MIYYVLFPALLFNSIAKSKIDFVLAAPALKTAVVVVIVGITLAWLARPLILATVGGVLYAATGLRIPEMV